MKVSMLRKVRYLVALAVLALGGAVASAWSKAGHMATGSVAYRVLKAESPATIPKVIAILKESKSYTDYWKKEIAALGDGADADEYLFMMASRWADDVRQNPRYYPEGGPEANYHYTNKPFKPEGQPDSVKTEVPAEHNIVRAFPVFLEAVKTETDKEKRANALCWVLHLVGDSHQPLHSTSLYTEKFQVVDHGRLVGDRGGTKFFVRQRPKAPATNLHAVWDNLLTNKDKYEDNKKAVALLMAAEEYAPAKFADEVAVLDMEKWIDESHTLARTKGYTFDGKLLDAGTKESEAVPLPEGYFAVAEPVAQRRGVLAGYRMAAILKATLAD